MHFEALTIDDLLNDVYKRLLNERFDVCPSRGKTSELVGVMLTLGNPLSRLSRTETKGKLFSAVGELLWYLAKTNDLSFISYYIPKYVDESEDKKTIYGAYGPRLFNSQGKYDQIASVISLLKENPNSRRAVIQILEPVDLAEKHQEIPCTCTLQFLLRHNKLNMVVHLRSNDAFMGLPHDIFCFTMLQELVAKTLNVELGSYSHSVGSLHLYEKDQALANQYLAEGFQSTKHPMPPMPGGSPWESIHTILEIEERIRQNQDPNINGQNLDEYWKDIIRLVYIFSLFKNHDTDKIKEVQKEFYYPVYNTFINTKLSSTQIK